MATMFFSANGREEPNLFLAYLSYFNIMKDTVKNQQFSKKYWRGFIKKAVGGGAREGLKGGRRGG